MKTTILTHLRHASAVVCLLAFGFPSSAQEAQSRTYYISVEVDETTDGDFSIVESALAGASEGAEISKSLRRVIMGVLGEVSVAVDSRIDENSILTLDDGSTVALLDGDAVQVISRKRPGAIIKFDIVCNPQTKRCHRQPVAICRTSGGVQVCSSIPPLRVRATVVQ
jgi:hypothetical protein